MTHVAHTQNPSPARSNRAFSRLGNPFVTALLRSPFHRALSGSTMLITVTGAKSRREYTTPVNYVREGDKLTVVSRRDRTWWRNVAGGAPVKVRIRGEEIAGTAEVAPAGGYDLIAAYMTFRKKLRHPVSAITAEMAARDILMIHVQLHPK